MPPRPSDLVETISKSLAVPLPTVREQARLLRLEDWMTVQPAGRSPGIMTPRDAVHLVMAVAGSARVVDSCRIVSQQCQFPVVEGQRWNNDLRLPHIEKLPIQHRFADAVEAFLLSAIDGHLDLSPDQIRERFDHVIASTGLEIVRLLQIWVFVTILDPYGRCVVSVKLRLQDQDQEEYWPLVQSLSYERSGHPFDPGFVAVPDTDLSRTYQFSHRTLKALAGLFQD